MASLSLFCDQSTGISQATNKSFGIDTADTNKFRVNSIFNVTGTVNAYAMVSGTVLLQQQTGVPAKVNLILRPHNQSDLKLPIKYIIYRGLETTAFIDSNNLTDPSNKVKTAGSEFLAAMQVIQQQRAPGEDIPIQALFGNELAPVGTKNIDEFFFKNLAAASQLFTIDCGIELGKFATGEVSIEIILENPEYFLTVEDTKQPLHEINVTGITNAAEEKWKQDLVRHFVDPAAYYGLHHDIVGGIEYRTGSGKQYANTPALVYNQIVDKFLTKNKVYLDVRNENGYSYNYYGNYVGTGADANKNIKIGQTATTLVAKEYYTNGWAVHTIDVTAGSGAENEIFVALRINDNERPLLASWNTEVTPYTKVDPAANKIYYVDETILLPNPILDFTNSFSFKVPNVSSSSPAQLATIVRLDYNKQIVNSALNIFALTGTTDYHFGTASLNIPWDTDDTVQWHTDNFKKFVDASEEIGFTGYIETGHIVDINTDDPSNENILLYAAPENYLLNEGFEKELSFNRKGGAANLESFINLLPDVSLERTNLMPSTNENILSFSLGFRGKLKKPIQLLGITKTEWETTINNAAASLSDNHLKTIKLKASGIPKTDLNGTDYADFEIVIAGMDNTGTMQEIATGLTAYTTDSLIFSTNNFSENYQIDYTEAEEALNKFLNILNPSYPLTSIPDFFDDIPGNRRSDEERSNLQSKWIHGIKNKNLFFLDDTMKNKVSELKTALDNAQEDYATIENLIKQKGADLLNYAKQRIKEQNEDYTNKDGILYLTRLMMQVVIKNHPKLLTKFPSKITDLSTLFEKNSRGLKGAEKPIFLPQTSTNFNILITGFDPFGGQDWENHSSNPSGNLALALSNEVIFGANSSTKKATVKTAIFPVRFKEFNNGWIEDFFTEYIQNDNVEMIITFSYGFNPTYNSKYGNSYFNIDRMASNYRKDIGDNDFFTPQAEKIISLSNSAFIENALGKGPDRNDYSEWIDSGNNFYLNQTYGGEINGKDSSGNILPTKNIVGTRVDDDYNNLITFPSESDLTFEPSYISDRNIIAKRGSGGTYLSNEIHYRVSYLRKDTNKRTGHIHVGFLKSDKDGAKPENRATMLNIIKLTLGEVIKNF